ncbi:MAG: flagellar biosynthesis protein FlhF [Epsilonproteobacteria bacterium]|nr:flagellar biosynthesis protein FlhF [Campylobacterota bacterium]
MKLFTFTASSPAIALQKAQKSCGRDALVVSTKQIRKKSLSGDAIYEIVVAVEESIPLKKESKTPPKKPIFDEEILENITQTAEQLSRLEKLSDPLETTTTQPSRLEKINQEIKEDEFHQIKSEIGALSDKIKILQTMLWDENSEAQRLSIPPEFAEIYSLTKKSGMKQSHLDEIMKKTLELMPPYMKNSSQTVKRYFHVLLKKMIPTRIEKEIPKGEKKIMMFVGPTGVGKTTTLAKLAARYSFLTHKNKVGIITLDTYRIGALEQLFQYAKMMKLPVEDVLDTIDFERALENLNHCDLILIDTVGSSQYDKEKILKIANFIKHTDRKIDVNLVLSATSKSEDLQDAYKSFSFLDIDTLIFTKLDETRGFGNIFSLIYDAKKPVSYFSIGQEVPDDIEVATGDFLVECIFEGFSKKVYS